MAGIAVFPTPASSPAMSSLSLAVERSGGPVLHAHTDPWLALSTTLHPYCVPIHTVLHPTERLSQRYAVRSQPSIKSLSIRSQTQTKHSASTGILHSHIQTRARHSPGNLLGAGRNHFFICLPSPPVSSTTLDCSSSASTCQEHRASVAISGPSRYIKRIAKP